MSVVQLKSYDKNAKSCNVNSLQYNPINKNRILLTQSLLSSAVVCGFFWAVRMLTAIAVRCKAIGCLRRYENCYISLQFNK